jgi:hypothetical protein
VANATYFQSHLTDQASLMVYAMDMTPLIEDPNLQIEGFVMEKIDHFRKGVKNRLDRLSSD